MTTVGDRRATSPARTRLAGFGTLLRLALRRDRVRLPVWVTGIVLATVGTAMSFPQTYPDAEARRGALLTIDNPGTTALVGAVYGEGDYTYGIMTGHQMLGLIAVGAALMSIFTVVRHTRAEEESGRAELVRAAPVGRHAAPLAALVLTLATNVLLGLLLTLSLAASGVESITWGGSAVFGAGVAAAGLVFAGVGAVTSQLTEHARAASSSAGLVLAAAFVLRAVGDVSSPTLSWLSPIGWAQATRPFFSDDWSPLLLAVGTAVVLLTGALTLGRHRDLAAGLLGTRPGPAAAGRGLRGPFGLAWRLNRSVVTGWALGMFIFGVMYGPALSEAATFLEDLPIMAEFLPEVDASGAELFASTVLAVFAIVASVPAVQIVLRLRNEELAGRAAPLLATPLPRVRWAVASHVLALLAGLLVLAAAGAGIGAGAAWSMSDPQWVTTATGAAVAYLPAVGVVVGLGALMHGVAPRAAGATWALVVIAAFFMYFGGILDLPSWLLNLSPFTHVAQQPAVELGLAPLGWLTLVAVVLAVLGLAGLRRRDVLDG